MDETLATKGSLGGFAGEPNTVGLRERLRSWAQRREEAIAGYAFLIPTFIRVAVFVVFPVAFSFYLSLHKWDYLEEVKPFVGLTNYLTILKSPDFWRVVKNTTYYAAGSIPLLLVVSLSLALLLNRKVRGLGFYRSAYFLPVVTSTVVMGQIWYWIYDPRFGLLNTILHAVGLPMQRWIHDAKLTMPSLIAMNVWHTTGYLVIIYLAALQGIPPEYYDAAKVDGADGWRSFRYITLPLLAPTTFFILIMLVIGSFQVFGQIFAMLWRTPMMSKAESIMIYLYKHAFHYYEMGYASAVAYLLFAIIFVLTLIQYRFRRRFEY